MARGRPKKVDALQELAPVLEIGLTKTEQRRIEFSISSPFYRGLILRARHSASANLPRQIERLRDAGFITYRGPDDQTRPDDQRTRIILNHEQVSRLESSRERYNVLGRFVQVAYGLAAAADAEGRGDPRLRITRSMMHKNYPLILFRANAKLYVPPGHSLGELTAHAQEVMEAVTSDVRPGDAPPEPGNGFWAKAAMSGKGAAFHYDHPYHPAHVHAVMSESKPGLLNAEIAAPHTYPRVPYVMFAGLVAMTEATVPAVA